MIDVETYIFPIYKLLKEAPIQGMFKENYKKESS